MIAVVSFTHHIIRSIDVLLIALDIFAFPITLQRRRLIIGQMDHVISVWCLLLAVELLLIQTLARIIARWDAYIEWYTLPISIAIGILILFYALFSRNNRKREFDGKKSI